LRRSQWSKNLLHHVHYNYWEITIF
jgi:hypothetical protein